MILLKITKINHLKNKLLFFFVISIALFATSCGKSLKKPDDAVARVYDKYLTKEDIAYVLHYGLSSEDSVIIIKSYIDNWIREQLVFAMAEKNLPDEKKDFDKQLEAYRNSLILFAYESELVRQKLDTTVSEEQIAAYYAENPAEFNLKDNIVKVVFAKLPSKSDKVNAFRNLIRSEKPEDKTKFVDLCRRFASNYFADETSWLLFDDLLKEVPIKTYDQENFLKNNRYIETRDSSYFYLVNIKGFMIKESLSPLSFEKTRIREIILNKRKIDLIKEMHNAAFKEASPNKDYQVY